MKRLRADVNRCMEAARTDGLLGASLEAAVSACSLTHLLTPHSLFLFPYFAPPIQLSLQTGEVSTNDSVERICWCEYAADLIRRNIVVQAISLLLSLALSPFPSPPHTPLPRSHSHPLLHPLSPLPLPPSSSPLPSPFLPTSCA